MTVRLLHSENISSPMLVTLFGMVIFPEQVWPSIKIPFTTTNLFFSLCFSCHGVPENAYTDHCHSVYCDNLIQLILHQGDKYRSMTNFCKVFSWKGVIKVSQNRYAVSSFINMSPVVFQSIPRKWVRAVFIGIWRYYGYLYLYAEL